MGPRPHSERSSLPNESSNNVSSELIPAQVVAESPSPPTLSPATTPSPIPQEIIVLDTSSDNVAIQEDGNNTDVSVLPCYPTPEDIMPYDHTLPDFIRQITNQPNLANIQSLSLRVISRLISLQRMSMYTPNLRELDLEGSMLSSLRDIGCNLKYLQVLKVGRCQLDSLDGTFGLTSLRELYAQKNQITDVSPCSNLPHIRHIDISSNRIRNISYAGFLSMCYKLRSINFVGNPAAEVPGYREHVRRILPQVEVLDNVPFLNDDNRNNSGLSELIENYSGSSGGSSVVDNSRVNTLKSPENMNNLFEPDEDPYCLEKFNKQNNKTITEQESFEATDYEVQEVFAAGNRADLERDLERLQLRNDEDNFRALEKANKELENKKSASIQKIEKDIENLSKKSNFQLKTDFDDDSFEQSDMNNDNLSRSPLDDLQGNYSDALTSLLTSSTKISHNDSFEIFSSDEEGKVSKEIKRPSTASGAVNCRFKRQDSETKSGAIKKRPSTAAPRLILADEDDESEQSAVETGASKLTTGMPVCGNITAALRHRRKHQTAWEDTEVLKAKKIEPLILMPKDNKNEVRVQLDSSGDSSDLNSSMKSDEELVGEDVLETSKKWREAFRRFRSNNRSRWEEEDNTDYSNILGDLEDQTVNDVFESDDE